MFSATVYLLLRFATMLVRGRLVSESPSPQPSPELREGKNRLNLSNSISYVLTLTIATLLGHRVLRRTLSQLRLIGVVGCLLAPPLSGHRYIWNSFTSAWANSFSTSRSCCSGLPYVFHLHTMSSPDLLRLAPMSPPIKIANSA